MNAKIRLAVNMEITAEVISAHFEKTEARNIRAAKNINRGKIQNKSKNPV